MPDGLALRGEVGIVGEQGCQGVQVTRVDGGDELVDRGGKGDWALSWSSRGPGSFAPLEPSLGSPVWWSSKVIGALVAPLGGDLILGDMHRSLPIGDFSRATHLSIKTLRHYHRIGLLEPADVDPGTGHRRYTADQISTAQVIRRFRALDMPLEEINAVISTSDLATRNDLISGHLSLLEATLARAQRAAASLRDLLQPATDSDPVEIERRQVSAIPAVAVAGHPRPGGLHLVVPGRAG